MRHPRTPTVLLALALTTGTAACSGGSAADAVEGQTKPAPGGPSTSPPPARDAPACAIPTRPVPSGGPAANRFGTDAVAAGYRFAADLLARSTFTRAPLADPQPPQAAFADTEAGLTARARQSFRELTAVLASPTETITPQQDADLVALASYGVTASLPGNSLRTPAYRDVTCGPATTEVLPRPGLPDALVLRFPVSGSYLVTGPTGAPEVLAYRKDMDLSLAPTDDPARPWLLDGWRARRHTDGPDPDPAG